MRQFIKHFQRVGVGDWVCIEDASLSLPQGRVEVTAGTRLKLGTKFMNVDLAAMLEAEYQRQENENSHPG